MAGLEIARQAFRFGVVGILSNAVLYVAYLALTSLSVSPKLSMTLLYVAGTLQTYFSNKKWTFGHNRAGDRSFLRYVICYATGYFINLLALTLFVDELSYPHQVVQGLMILFLAAAMFLAQKYWVFKKHHNFQKGE